MIEKLKGYLSKKGASLFAVLAWIAFIVGGAAFVFFTLVLAGVFELIGQLRNRVASFI